ncbi:hypothetical protein ACQP25_28670 [Microtetraspora malaysiensis]|uniref:hypothetical protein n=1 Tax=Microtetraspora malaysiensis TaxID=161358 RepID=UPI003D8FC07A
MVRAFRVRPGWHAGDGDGALRWVRADSGVPGGPSLSTSLDTPFLSCVFARDGYASLSLDKPGVAGAPGNKTTTILARGSASSELSHRG